MQPGEKTATRRRKDSARQYPPLLIGALSVLALLAVFPSSLNLPQSNPAETLEYAPIPPDDDEYTPPQGNFSALGLGGSDSFVAPGSQQEPTFGGEVPGGRAIKAPSTKRCVGDPPRQTEDPLSPPCVATFTGDNGGATYQGVTREEVRVVFSYDGFSNGVWSPTSRGVERFPPANSYFDLAQPPEDDDEFVFVRQLRLLQRYLNDRYQTYGRFVHFYAVFGSATKTPEARRSDAIELLERVGPFAVVTYVQQNSEAYVDVLARRRVMVFVGSPIGETGQVGQPADFFRKYAPLIWSYVPSLEERARMFTTYVCTKVVPYPVSFSQNPDDVGRVRVLGLLSNANSSNPIGRLYTERIKHGIEACGGRFDEEATYPSNCALCREEAYQAAVANMTQFRQGGVTTIIMPGGMNAAHSHVGSELNYRPEWVIAGDGTNESSFNNGFHDADAWRSARLVTLAPAVADPVGQPCVQALKEADPSSPTQDALVGGCHFYNDFRQLSTGIQVAGPRLTPASMDRGFHAIPAIPSGDPRVPACFYGAGDYTCVKDSHAQWWDPEGRPPGGRGDSQGCWRMVERGRRFLAGHWPEEDVDSRKQAGSDVCNAQ